MKLIVNGTDATPLTGKLTEFRGETLLSLRFLESLQSEGFEVVKTENEYRLNFTPEALLHLLSTQHPFPANLSVNIETDPHGQILAKAKLALGKIATASVDQHGKIETALNVSF